MTPGLMRRSAAEALKTLPIHRSRRQRHAAEHQPEPSASDPILLILGKTRGEPVLRTQQEYHG